MEKTHKIDVVSIRLVEEPPLYSSKELKNPCDVAELFQDFLKDCDREMFCILNLRTKNQVINVNVVGMGTLNSVLVHPREVFKSAIYPMPAVSFWHITTLPVIQNQAGMI